ncbi:uncharacterized protein LOC142237518 [Haematobia irritans]|uniref:uncharacterized protein LOC142237518 n=1 Tax=Haematobia irritans TaxID=7368 RepID=UPI003F508895
MITWSLLIIANLAIYQCHYALANFGNTGLNTIYSSSSAFFNYAPLCGVLNNEYKTFLNVYEFMDAIRMGSDYQFFCEGLCPNVLVRCTGIQPVCASNGKSLKSFDNICAMYEEIPKTETVWFEVPASACPITATTTTPTTTTTTAPTTTTTTTTPTTTTPTTTTPTTTTPTTTTPTTTTPTTTTPTTTIETTTPTTTTPTTTTPTTTAPTTTTPTNTTPETIETTTSTTTTTPTTTTTTPTTTTTTPTTTTTTTPTTTTTTTTTAPALGSGSGNSRARLIRELFRLICIRANVPQGSLLSVRTNTLWYLCKRTFGM